MNKKTTKIALATFAAIAGFGLSQALAQGNELRLAGAFVADKSAYTNLPNFIKFGVGQEVKPENLVNWAVYAFNVPNNSTFKAYETFNDELGYTHTRYKQYVNNYPVEGTQIIAHAKDGIVKMVNGDYYQNFNSNMTASLSEQGALQYALQKVNAKKYMWEDEFMVKAHQQSYLPTGELVVVHKRGADFSANNTRLAYKFNIYAAVPLSRAYIYVDANTGEILDKQNLIHTADVVGTASTKFSGNVTMTCDNASGPYRLHESGRGNGIVTQNLNNGTNYGSATDFTNGSSAWNLAGNNKAATDAHWGAEMTYDYYKLIHGRNSIDGAGYALNSYMHYSSNYVNAFWDGSEMTYGDGDVTQGFLIMTALDVCGHEITHGLTSFTSGLNGGGAGEPDALNEGNSDIFGTTIEAYARPTQWDWIMGADITCNGSGVQNFIGIRDMSNPKNPNYPQPNCYQGTYWDAGGEPHNNDGPFIYWYYLLCQGGSGTNDIGNAWSVTGITMAKAKMIAFRQNTVYFTSSTTYANARTFSMQAATDLYGSCSTELQMTANAWYAIGVGTQFTSAGPVAGYSTGSIGTCGLPVAVTFSNTSTNSTSYSWTFGDGGTSTATSPTHTYSTAGTFVVTLVATGCGGSLTNTYTTSVNITGGGATALPLVEGLEASTSIPAGWTLYNPDADAAWEISTTVAKTGTHSMGFNNCNGDNTTDMTGRIDRVITKSYDFSTMAAASMSFDVAYAVLTYSGTPYNDQLQVYSSINCGTTWTSIYNKSGTTLASAPGYTNAATCWAPTSTQWRNDVINLSSVLGKPNVMFAFENTSGWGTWLYLDNINITGTTGISSYGSQDGSVMIYPNPAHDNLTVKAIHDISSVNIVDVIGKTVIEANPHNGNSVDLDISSLSAGVYFVKVNADNTQKLIRVIKQ
jgi:Zn-dependent metalloprotease